MLENPNLLGSLPFFAGVDDAALVALSTFAKTRNVKAGQVLAREGDTLQNLMFVISGRLVLLELAEDGRIIGRGLFGPGQAVGMITLIDGKPGFHLVQAVEDVELLTMPMPTARQFVMDRPLLQDRLLQMLASVLRQHHKEKAMLSLPNAFHRVFSQINLLATEGDAGSPTPLPKQQEIASTVNTSRETVSRALQMLIKSGVLSKQGHQIVIKRVDALQRLAAEGPDALKTIDK